MKLQLLAPWAAVIAAVCAASPAHAWTISTSPSAAGSTVQNAPLAKTWTITGDSASTSALEAITVQSMGRVFIDYDASLGDDVAAKVIVSSDARDLLDAIEVVDADVPTDAEKTDAAGVKIHFQNDAFEGQGHVLTQVFVSRKHALRNVTTAWSSDVVVGSDVLVENDRTATVGLALTGSGSLFAGSPSTKLSLAALGVTLTGSGGVQLLAKSVAVADAFETTLDGDGVIGVVAGQIAVDGTLSSLVSGGAGHVIAQGDRLTAHNISTTIAGAGRVTLSRDGACENQNVVVVGSGNVSTASIACANTFVNLVGSSDILVQATESLTVASFFLGDVSYFGATPKTITASSMFDYGVTHPTATETVQKATENAYEAIEVQPTPKREPVFVVVKAAQGDDAGEGSA